MEQTIEPVLRPRRAHRGQTLIVALAILFILLFIGGIFVAQVARNLGVAGRSRDTENSRQLAEAGIQFCDRQLTYSAEGADWRPQPTAPQPFDPDAFWLNQGFSRIDLQRGRALVRVVYGAGQPGSPHNTQLRIESIGLPGEVSGNDPTLLVQNGLGQRLRSERVAYKQIGLTDFLMYVMNHQHRQYENFLGSTSIGVPLITQIGDPNTVVKGSNAFNPNAYNGGIQINGSVRWGGNTFIYANPDKGEGVTIADNLLLAPTVDLNGDGIVNDSDVQTFLNMVPDDASLLTTYYLPTDTSNAHMHVLYPSASPYFSTIGGIVRDGSTQPDSKGFFRGGSFLEPPSIDGQVAGSGVLRYRALTRDSGFWFKDANGKALNTGFFGWGDGIYVDNFEDLQPETQVAVGGPGKSLPSEWVHPEDPAGTHWSAPYYTPPGVEITLLGDHILVTRHDSRPIRKTDGQPVTGQGGKQILIPLLDADRKTFLFPDGTDPTKIGPNIALPNLPHNGLGTDVTIMTEGNARVKGFFGLGANAVHVTLVCGGTAYIDGNVVKGDTNRNSTCAVLAKDYVTVNTTQFMASEKANWTLDNSAGQPNSFFHSEVTPGADGDNVFTYSNGYALNPNPYNTPMYLLMRHAADSSGGVAINLGINMGQAVGALYNFTGPNSTTDVLGLTPILPGLPNAVLPNYEQAAFNLAASSGSISGFAGVENALMFQIDPQYQLPSSGNYAIGGVMVAPMDIRIEALLFAQDKSFFIIPGYYLNRDSSDTRENAMLNKASNPSRVSQNEFPFYNEPTDVRLTIYGAIAQNYTASIGDQAAWQAHWGYIPQTFGSSNQSVPSVHLLAQDPAYVNANEDGTTDHRTPFEQKAGITRGIRYLYDPAFALANANGPVRYETVLINNVSVNRNLPPIPRLPVCPGLLYSGDSNSPIGGY